MLSTAGFIVRGLQELPGRKSLVLFSESIQLADAPKALNNPLATTMSPGGMGDVREQTIKAIRSLVDLANKSGVTFYTINPRGLQPLAATAGIRWLATLDAIQWARINSIPFLGTCGGFQHAVIEYARNVLHWNEADHAESNPPPRPCP